MARRGRGTPRPYGVAIRGDAHTVHHHIERLRAELAVGNRIELAAWAGCHGIYSPRPAGLAEVFPTRRAGR